MLGEKRKTTDHALRQAAFQTSQLTSVEKQSQDGRWGLGRLVLKSRKPVARSRLKTSVHLEIKESEGPGKMRVNDPHGSDP